MRKNLKLGPVAVAVLVVLAGCGGPVLYDREVDEMASPRIDRNSFQTIALISGASTDEALRIAARVRDLMADAGWNLERAEGRWETEREALDSLCGSGEPPLGGILFVWWDKLELYDCELKERAYLVRGGYAGVDRMTERLVRYLGPGPDAAEAAAGDSVAG